ncbi:UDP-N-acetylglucosamine--N-acetylmuramyl-(pentapeptide) pyrophosphoryl-undecaprenol N-acetylglucosamine transferase [invertebrate metagenome]|uniref:UDP-N-acetylglucosamine--N-acetylmuramyl-(Pentapeptide) pyrophosphoryl-undecaprenol N-acetylglucosamine transferase n=1 Tax=invertebrate metagenome TaxID=1711999 RepID=A0A484H5U9_9ZZZZ
MLAAGGTGGHVFPAEVLAEELRRRGYALTCVTDRRGTAWYSSRRRRALENLSVHAVVSGGLAGRSLFGTVAGGARLTWGIGESWILLKSLHPEVVVGFGSYASVPVIIASLLAGYPTMVHEQNAVLGRANRLLAPWVSRVAVSFAPPLYNAGTTVLHTGTPVRPEMQAIRNVPYVPPNDANVVRVLVIGGSQGAHIFSDVIPAALSRLPVALRTRLRVSQQVRVEDRAAVVAAYDGLGIDVEVESFFDDVQTRLVETHLVIARAGASTVAELTVAGRPAILVPYPHAINDHQTANARAMAETGGAWLVPQVAFTPEALATKLQTLFALPAILAEAAMCARRIALPDAAQRLADMVESLTGPDEGSRKPSQSFRAGWMGIRQRESQEYDPHSTT